MDSGRTLDWLLRQTHYQVSCRKGKIAVDDTVFSLLASLLGCLTVRPSVVPAGACAVCKAAIDEWVEEWLMCERWQKGKTKQ